MPYQFGYFVDGEDAGDIEDDDEFAGDLAHAVDEVGADFGAE
jgi:hypothetical protein